MNIVQFFSSHHILHRSWNHRQNCLFQRNMWINRLQQSGYKMLNMSRLWFMLFALCLFFAYLKVRLCSVLLLHSMCISFYHETVFFCFYRTFLFTKWKTVLWIDDINVTLQCDLIFIHFELSDRMMHKTTKYERKYCIWLTSADGL